MLRQIELKIELPEGVRLHSSMGSVFHGAMMEIIGSDAATWLHSLSSVRPFTQCLYYNRTLQSPIWRISALSEEADKKIIEPILNTLGKEIFLRQKNYPVILRSLENDTVSSYQKLADEVFLTEDVPLGVNVNMFTVTSFKRDGMYLIVPERYLIFQSLINRWNLFSKKNKLEGSKLEYELADSCFVSNYKLQTQMFSLENSNIKGFRGSIQLKFRANEMVRRIMGLLIAYGQFAGLGIKTALGMGGLNTECFYNPRRKV